MDFDKLCTAQLETLKAERNYRSFARMERQCGAAPNALSHEAAGATIHARGEDGNLTPMDNFALPDDPEVHMGGHGLYGTVTDYMKFIRMRLNDGNGPRGACSSRKRWIGPSKARWWLLGDADPALCGCGVFHRLERPRTNK